jgi:NAD(P)-dependent dehydrogenase (short-subunit alcohol dehydrogenase family)
MAGRLKGRHIVITGAAAGIGQAIAALFAAEGARLALLDRDYDKLEGGPGHPIQVDVADEQSVAAAVDAAAKALTRIDGLVNAAGIFPISSLEQWQRTIEVNLTGPFLMCRAALPHLSACDAATIVNLGSASAIVPFTGLGAYAASKGGIATFTKVLAAELAPKIRANVLCPGMTRTRMVSDWYPDQHALTERAQALYPLQRIAEPSEIAAAALFLTSQESSFMTGTTLTVDGGRTFH